MLFFPAVSEEDLDEQRSLALTGLPEMQSSHHDDIMAPSREISLLNSSRLADRVRLNFTSKLKSVGVHLNLTPQL